MYHVLKQCCSPRLNILKNNVACLLYLMSNHGTRMFLLKNELTELTSVINFSEQIENIIDQLESVLTNYSQ